MSFEEYRCMIRSEDAVDEEYAVCQYPKCWLEDCPHKQARDSLTEAEKHLEKLALITDKVMNTEPYDELLEWEGRMKSALRGVVGESEEGVK